MFPVLENGSLGSSCQVEVPATASGAFVPNASDHTDLPSDTASWSQGRYGNDAHGRAVIDIVAPDGRDSPYPWYNNAYQTSSSVGTSLAAPVVAGAAANHIDWLATHYSSWATNVSVVHAQMLLMGDGRLDPSGYASATTPMDSGWGAGRLRMRLFTDAGMDYPWRSRWAYIELDDAEVYSMDVHPDGSGVNQIVPADAEVFRAAIWEHEPNLEGTPAAISLAIREDGGTTTYTNSSTNPQDQRLRIGSAISGKAWNVRVTGLDITASGDTNYHWLAKKRWVAIAFYWEDADRDDSDGPSADID